MFARQDNREDVKPWAIINAVSLIQLHVVFVMMVVVVPMAMWLTEQ